MKRNRFTAALLILFSVILILLSVKSLLNRRKASGLKINEICTSNFSVSYDSLGEYRDYIELINMGDEDIDLSGYKIGVADEKGGGSWEIPEGTVKPGEYRLIFASKDYGSEEEEYDPDRSLNLREYLYSGSFFEKEKADELHLPMGLSKEGCSLVLISPAGDNTDKVEVPYLDRDMTFSRYPDSKGDFRIRSGTPGKGNDTSVEMRPRTLRKPEFSVESGFYDKPFYLNLKGSAGQKIYYTLDGSDPDENSILYTSPIEITEASDRENLYSAIADVSNLLPKGNRRYPFALPEKRVDKATVVRAAVVDEKGNLGEIGTETYFVGIQEEKYKDTAVISLASDPEGLFGSEKGIYVLGDAGHEYLKEHPEVKYWGIANYRFQGREWEREADMAVFGEDHALMMNVKTGIRIKGNWSRCFPQKSLNLYSRKIYSGADSFPVSLLPGDSREKSVSLFSGGNDVDYKILDRLGALLAEPLNISVIRYRPAHLFLNGEYWGIEYISDRFNEDYIHDRYGVPRENTAVIKDNLPVGGNPEASKLYEELRYMAYSGLSDKDSYERFKEAVDIDSMTDYYAFEIYIGAQNDWPTRNFALWRSIKAGDTEKEDCRWRYMLFDLNHKTMDLEQMDIDNLEKALEDDAVFAAAFENPDFRQEFFKKLDKMEEIYCSYTKVNEKISKLEESSASHMAMWYERFYNGAVGEEGYHKKISAIREYFKRRPGAVKKLKEKYNGTQQ